MDFQTQVEILNRAVSRIVVLMMENRSFDHMLGWLPPERGGLSGTEFCPLTAPAPGAPPVAGGIGGVPGHVPFETTETRLPISPSHAGSATLRQINGGNMQGFVQEFREQRAREIATLDDDLRGSGMPMAFYGRNALLAYRHLADHEVVCSRYHASIPGGTWPNRMFLYSGTSAGLLGNGNVVRRKEAYDCRMRIPVIGDLLDAQPTPVPWAVYTHNLAWLRLYPDRQDLGPLSRRFQSFDRDCRRNELPALVFVDPRFGDDIGAALPANDDLAPANLVDGQQFVAEVYQSLAQLPVPARQGTLLVITYDEHGGFYDHAPPPAVPVNDPLEGEPLEIGVEPSAFSTYGVRVPTFVCSAFAPPGTSSDVVLDHASVHATIHRRFLPGVPFLSLRAEAADTLATLLTLDKPRTAFPVSDLPGRLEIGREARQGEREERRQARRERREDRREQWPELRRERREERGHERRAPTEDDEDGGLRAFAASLLRRA
ncbi:MAG: alkaline phosphatase family protein [Candidatus Binatia bacterium]